MPSFEPNSPRINVKVNGTVLTLPAPYSEGHVLTAPEAAYLNRQVATSVVNPIPGRIKAEAEGYKGLSEAELQAKIDALYATYEVGASNRGGGAPGEPADPVERVLTRMATDFINSRLKAKGKNINEVKKARTADDKSVYASLVQQAIEANPAWHALAVAQVAALADTTDDLDLDFGTEQAAA